MLSIFATFRAVGTS